MRADDAELIQHWRNAISAFEDIQKEMDVRVKIMQGIVERMISTNIHESPGLMTAAYSTSIAYSEVAGRLREAQTMIDFATRVIVEAYAHPNTASPIPTPESDA